MYTDNDDEMAPNPKYIFTLGALKNVELQNLLRSDLYDGHFSEDDSFPDELTTLQTQFAGKNDCKVLDFDQSSFENGGDEDFNSANSVGEDIDSQASVIRTTGETIAQESLRVLLAQNKTLSTFSEEALTTMDQDWFIDNFQWLLKEYYLDLSRDANTDMERATTNLLKSRKSRARIAQHIAAKFGSGNEETRTRAGEDIQKTDSREVSIRDIGDADIFPDVTITKDFLVGGDAFRKLLINLGTSLIPSESGSDPRAIMSIPADRIWFSAEDDTSTLNRLKIFLEDLTRENWNWWPLRPKMQRLRENQTRLHWRCVSRLFIMIVEYHSNSVQHCNEHLWMELSTAQARIYQLLLEQRIDPNQCFHLCRRRQYKPPRITTALTKIAQAIWSGSRRTFTNQSQAEGSSANSSEQSVPLNAQESPTEKTRQRSVRVLAKNQPEDSPVIELQTGDESFVFFRIQGTRRTLELVQINVKKYDNDATFFRELKDQYRKHRGFWRHWFSIWQWHHCDFTKVCSGSSKFEGSC
jgi:hypothetical protein